MRCPFLREEQVKSCRAVPFRKALSRSALRGAEERCSSAAHSACAAARHSYEAHPVPSHCPFLQESLVQFCAAAPVPTYVPWSDSSNQRCAHDGHRFCGLYLGVAGAGGRGPAPDAEGALEDRTFEVDGIAMPAWLFYAPNHLWLDVGDDDLVHLGVDAFLARRLGVAERLQFLTVTGRVRPAVVLRARGADLALTFARPLQLVAANTHLRASPQRLTEDPYGRGWLFEARVTARCAPEGQALLAGLLHGQAARAWMAREVRAAAGLGG